MPKHTLQAPALLIILVATLLSACAGPAAQAPTTAAPTEAPTTAAPTEAPTTAAPTEAPVVIATPKASPAVTGLGDSYFPLQGNPGYDAQHYTLELAVDSATLNQITGTATMEAQAQNDLPSFNMDFLGLEVSSVAVDGNTATFSRDGQELTITPATPIAAGATFKAAVTYAGVPQLYQDPALRLFAPANTEPPRTGWKERDKGYSAILSQPDGAMTWFPSNNTPRDKATYTFRITVDAPKMALASGILKEVVPVDTDTNTYVWEMNQPMSTQVATVIIGQFELRESNSPAGVRIRNYFPPGLDPQVIASYDRTGEMLDFVATIFGPYPYDAYGVAIVPGWPDGLGYETQSLSTMGPGNTDQLVTVHELGHQWFGNAITVRNWESVWLHEGFARYIELLWLEKTEGVAAYNKLLEQQVLFQNAYGEMLPPLRGEPALPKGQVIPPANQGVEYAYWSSYTGGALTLHALRMEVGDETFFTILKTFFQRYKDVPVVTEDFIATAEEVAGRDLSGVWDTWLYGTSIPADFPQLKEAYQYQ
ncbi:MAG: M1 family metallopeptidase [Chloroflexales bacterium]|nr:M1 family metallopeptidase [Chloroflexales bacterium]